MHVGNLSNSVHICNQIASHEMHNQSSVSISQSVRSQLMQGGNQSIFNKVLCNAIEAIFH